MTVLPVKINKTKTIEPERKYSYVPQFPDVSKFTWFTEININFLKLCLLFKYLNKEKHKIIKYLMLIKKGILPEIFWLIYYITISSIFRKT